MKQFGYLIILIILLTLMGLTLQLSCKPCTLEQLNNCKPLPTTSYWCTEPQYENCACCPICPKKYNETCNNFSVGCGKDESGEQLYCTLYIRDIAREQKLRVSFVFMDYEGVCDYRNESLPLDLSYNGWQDRLNTYKYPQQNLGIPTV